MPSEWSDKDERQYDKIKTSSKKRGKSAKRSKEIAARTVNKRRGEEGRTKKKSTRTGSSARKSSSRSSPNRKKSSRSSAGSKRSSSRSRSRSRS